MTQSDFADFLANKRTEKEFVNERTFDLLRRNTKEDPLQSKVTINDFNVIKLLGRGSFGKVLLVEKKDSKELFALKILNKKDILANDQLNHIQNERKILEKARHPFLISLEYAFQTDDRIYLVMKYMRGGELFHHLKKRKRFEEGV